MRWLTTTGGQLGIEVVRALDVQPTPTGGPRLSVTAAR
jgi:hypothetical protein